MPESRYGWSLNGSLPTLEHHSIAKHEILRAYLAAYVQTLLSNPNRDEFKLTLVDGFCGGGSYVLADTREERPGSPLIMLDAMREAEALVNISRERRIRFDVDCFFIDEDAETVAVLNRTLIARQYGAQIGKSIHLWHSDFNTKSAALIEHVKRRMPLNGRAIFLLDQYGYTDVPADTIRNIMTQVPSAEVILTFNVSSLLTYITDKDGRAEALLASAGTPGCLRGRSIEDIKRNQGDWRLFIRKRPVKAAIAGV